MAQGDKSTPSESRVLKPNDAKILSRQNTVSERKAAQTRLTEDYASLRLQSKPASKAGPSLFRKSILSRIRERIAAIPSPIRRTFRVLGVLSPIIPIAAAFHEHVMQTMWVKGPSMTPYLNEDWAQTHVQRDLLLVNLWLRQGLPWKNRSIRLERGMVVSFRSPANPSNIAIKRIVGLPGDRITTREPSLKPSIIVPWNHVWVEGDAEDPNKSLDSNSYGPISVSLIQGRVSAVLFPRMRWLNWQDWEAGKRDDSTSENYRQSVRDRVEKEAVQIQRPMVGGQWS